jgi:hypothetical protein
MNSSLAEKKLSQATVAMNARNFSLAKELAADVLVKAEIQEFRDQALALIGKCQAQEPTYKGPSIKPSETSTLIGGFHPVNQDAAPKIDKKKS